MTKLPERFRFPLWSPPDAETHEGEIDGDFKVGLHPTFSLYYEFCVLGCQGDRTPMYRAFAPFFKGDKGDRRVTGVCAHNQKMVSGYRFAPPYGYSLSRSKSSCIIRFEDA